MREHTDPIKPPSQAGPLRRLLHTLVALGGWLLFIYWWWLVFHRVSRSEIQFTLYFVTASLVVIVLATALWARHNVRIYRKRGPRTHLREVAIDLSHDGVGRPVSFGGPGADPRSAPVVIVRVTEDGKRYEPTSSLPPPVSAPEPAARPEGPR
jgi:hypothetical protein